MKKEVDQARVEKREIDTIKYKVSNEIQQTVKDNILIKDFLRDSDDEIDYLNQCKQFIIDIYQN